MNTTKFSTTSKRQDLELFFAHCGEHESYVRYLFLILSQTRGEINVANELLERTLNGDWISIKVDAYTLGYGA